jgi:hypothetical protein
MKKIRMLLAYAAYKKGEVLELPDQQADSLIAWEYAKPVVDDQRMLIETATEEHRARRADVTPRRKP